MTKRIKRISNLSRVPELIKCIRWYEISPEELVTKVEAEGVEWILSIPERHHILSEAFK